MRFWPDAVRNSDQVSLLSSTLQLVERLGDEDLADGFLDPFAVEALDPADAPLLVAATDRYGLEWFDRRLSALTAERRPHLARSVPGLGRAEWIGALGELRSNLLAADGRTGAGIASRFLRNSVDWMIDAVEKSAQLPAPSRREAALSGLVPPMVAVLDTTRVLDDTDARDRLIAAACEPTDQTVPLLVEVLEATSHLPRGEADAMGLGTIAEHCHGALVGALGRPPRASDEWSITDVDLGGCCANCDTLADFIADPELVTTTWPLAEARRSHIHHRIDEAELAVTHVTRREGRPYKLVLTKTAALHQQDADRRARQTEAALRG